MKAADLQIGDLVTWTDCQYDEHPIVVKIWQIDAEGCAFASIDGSGVLDEITIDEEIVGIPLTPKILEKNGFDGAYKKTYQIYKSNGYDKLYISYWRGRLSIITSPDIRKKHSTNTIHIDCSYVHELQHALRLCGIEKEIEL